MKRVKKRIILIIGLVVICLSMMVAPVFGYSYNDIRWEGNYTYYDMSGVPGGWQYPIMYAASAWNQAGADWMFAGSSSDNDLTTADTGETGVLAIGGATLLTWHSGDQCWYITECMIEYNTYYDWYTDGRDYDVQAVTTHEFGHWLELNHTYDPDDVMYYGYTGNRDLSEGEDGDIAGIIFIYGAY